MACFTEGVDSQETETLEVDSEGEKPRREPEEQDVNLSDQSLAKFKGVFTIKYLQWKVSAREFKWIYSKKSTKLNKVNTKNFTMWRFKCTSLMMKLKNLISKELRYADKLT